ncbi:MAG: thiamine pyrophosphate-dependent enzyme, partial [Candidatus Dormibacteraceae bacterium]
LHEIPHQLEMLASVTKWAGRIDSPERTESMVADAFARLAEGRPRPVALEVPVDVLEAPATHAATDRRPTAPPPPDLSGLEAAVALLRSAERPLVVAGGGVMQSGAWAELRLVAERLQAPVLLTANARGALPSDHPLAFNVVSAKSLVGSADVILAVGTRFAAARGERFQLEPTQHLIRIDADSEELSRDASPEVAIAADALRPLSMLAESVPEVVSNGWRGLEELHAEAHRKIEAVQPQAAFGAAIRAALPDDTVIIGGMTQLGYWSQIGLPVRQPRTYLGAGYQGALGFEVPTGLGAQVGSPQARVVALSGDGGFMFNVQELATAAQYRIPAVFVVFNDGAYGNVKRTQRERFGRVIASELKNPDLVRLAESFGITAFRAEGPEALGQALRQAMDADGPVLIDAPVGEMPAVWPLLRA